MGQTVSSQNHGLSGGDDSQGFFDTNPSGSWEIVNEAELTGLSDDPGGSNQVPDRKVIAKDKDETKSQTPKVNGTIGASNDGSSPGKVEKPLQSEEPCPVPNERSGFRAKKVVSVMSHALPERPKRKFGSIDGTLEVEKASNSQVPSTKFGFQADDADEEKARQQRVQEAIAAYNALKAEKKLMSNTVTSKKSIAKKAQSRIDRYIAGNPSPEQTCMTAGQSPVKLGNEEAVLLARKTLVIATKSAMIAMQEMEKANCDVAEAARQLHLAKRSAGLGGVENEDGVVEEVIGMVEEEVLRSKGVESK